MSMTPPATCAVTKPCDRPWPCDEVVELPCPRDPMQWQQYIWHKIPEYMECIALPTHRNLKSSELTKEDVDFIWKRGQELHARGYLSMAAYFGQCRGHPMAEYAQSLYWSDWKEMIR